MFIFMVALVLFYLNEFRGNDIRNFAKYDCASEVLLCFCGDVSALWVFFSRVWWAGQWLLMLEVQSVLLPVLFLPLSVFFFSLPPSLSLSLASCLSLYFKHFHKYATTVALHALITLLYHVILL